jgi:transcription elongation factor Elf1
MSDDSTRAPDIEMRCPKCGSEAFAWVSTENGIHTFECRKCKVLFSHKGDW